MKRRVITAVSVALTVVFVISVYALAQGEVKDQQVALANDNQNTMGPMMGCSMSGMRATPESNGSPSPQPMMQRCMAMMQKAGVTPEMMQCWQVMMGTPVFLDSPCAIYGQADILKLSEEQKKKLVEIENGVRKKALAVLTDEQKKKLGDIPEKPMAMARMCQQVCSKMMPMMQEMMGSEGNPGPMMQMMCGKSQEGSMKQTPPDSNAVQAESSEQITCPVVRRPINKNFFTVYKGKKVYFCCGGPCKGKFEANPKKYQDKLPQFKELKNGNPE